MELQWKKFKDGCGAHKHQHLYVTDWESVWLECPSTDIDCTCCSWEKYAQQFPEYGYAYIPMPKTPHEPFSPHECISSMIHVFEQRAAAGNINLWMKVKGDNGWAKMYIVTFCPMCGYKAYDKKD